jgi:hypothetical protein
MHEYPNDSAQEVFRCSVTDEDGCSQSRISESDSGNFEGSCHALAPVSLLTLQMSAPPELGTGSIVTACTMADAIFAPPIDEGSIGLA